MDTAKTDWIASLAGRRAEMTEKVVRTLINLLLSILQMYIGKKMFAQVRSLVYSQLPSTNDLLILV